MKTEDGSQTGITKRQFVKRAAYVVPAVLTLTTAPSFASAGSNSRRNRKRPGWAEELRNDRSSRR